MKRKIELKIKFHYKINSLISFNIKDLNNKILNKKSLK